MSNTHDLSANILDFGLSVYTGIVQAKGLKFQKLTIQLGSFDVLECVCSYFGHSGEPRTTMNFLNFMEGDGRHETFVYGKQAKIGKFDESC